MKQRNRSEDAEARHTGAPFDVIGIGFGPANLALAACLKEQPELIDGRLVQSLFLERKTHYEWHPDMLIQGADVQVPFLKDLVSLRNPISHFSFLNYLHVHGRLHDFVNLRTFFPTRVEFNHYYTWVAGQLADRVRYAREVLSVQPVESEDGGGVELLKVTARHLATGRSEEYLTRNLVVATGGSPYIPDGIDISTTDKVFHSQTFLAGLRQHFPNAEAPHRFIVVGSGQSAAEIFHYLFSNYPNADVTATMRRFAYKPADESEFVNEIYAPATTDMFFSLPEAERRSLREAHADTNYSAVDIELIRSIFRAMYQMKVNGQNRVRVRAMCELKQIEKQGDSLVATVWNKVSARAETLEADGIVLATGFTRPRRHPLLRELNNHLLTTVDGSYDVRRDYRVRNVDGFAPGIYLQGFCETTHGISDAVLSVLPIRSQEIVQSIVGSTCSRGDDLAEPVTSAAYLPSSGEPL